MVILIILSLHNLDVLTIMASVVPLGLGFKLEPENYRTC
jgi:hypothetical protein